MATTTNTDHLKRGGRCGDLSNNLQRKANPWGAGAQVFFALVCAALLSGGVL